VLTEALARRAWARFQEVEARGGLAAAIKAGWVQQLIATVATQRDKDIATRRQILVGTNMYVNPEEKTLGQVTGQAVRPEGHGPSDHLTPGRDSEPFEALRLRAEAIGRPRAFLANIGPRAQHRARADFATGFLQVAGIQVIDNTGFATPDAAAQAAIASGAPIVVLCSSDPTYLALVPPLVAAVKAARPQTLCLLAGYPADQIEALSAAGVDVFIHLRSDAVAVLGEILDWVGGDS
jgi:methylmalonyl-CoA mutase